MTKNRLGRRDLMKAAAGAALLLGTSRSGAEEKREADKGPRYFLQIWAAGGIDPVYTTDPKSRAELESWADVPYGSSDIISAGGVHLGPHFAPLKGLAPRLAILNGIQVNTANHQTGKAQYDRLKLAPHPRSPGLLEIVARGRDTQPLGLLHSRKWLEGNPSLLGTLEGVGVEQLGVMSSALRAQAKSLGASSQSTTEQLVDTANLLDRLASTPRFVPEVWSADGWAQQQAVKLQRALWAFQFDLARCFLLDTDTAGPWDSHWQNANVQTRRNTKYAPVLARFFQALENISNAHGRLSDTTAVVFGSEIGRYPRLNDSGGKDHWPEIPLVFYGKAFNTGSAGASYGSTDRRLIGRRLSMKTGKYDSDGQYVMLDDIGATLLHVAGVADPSVYGYGGKVLPFLV